MTIEQILRIRVFDKNFYSEPSWLTVTCPLCHTQQRWANITIQLQLTILIVRHCVAPKWSNSYSRMHHLVFTLGQMVCHTGLYIKYPASYTLQSFVLKPVHQDG